MSNQLTSIQLLVHDGHLHTPHTAIQEQYLKDFYSSDPICLVHYEAGDYDTIPWPMTTPEQLTNLAKSLYDSREIGVIPSCKVLLPNNEEFPIDQYIK